MPVDPGHHRPDRRQVEVVIRMEVRLVRRGQRVLAMRAGWGKGFDGAIGIFRQRPEASRPADPRLLRRFRPVGLFALGRRQRGIAGSLGWLAQPGLQFGNPSGQHLGLGGPRQHRSDQFLFGQAFKGITSHPILESHLGPAVNANLPIPGPSIHTKNQG